MPLKRLAVLTALILPPAALHAEPLSGNALLRACEAENPAGVEQGVCVGFIIGSVESMMWGALVGMLTTTEDDIASEDYDMLSSQVLGFCIPAEVENGQIIAIVTQHLRDNPAGRHMSARILIQAALQLGFPYIQFQR